VVTGEAEFPSLTEGEQLRKSKDSLVTPGIDRCSLSFPLGGFEADETAWSAKTVTGPGTPTEAVSWATSVTVGDPEAGVKAYVGVKEVPESKHRWWGKVEFNPSRIVDPKGFSLATVSQLRPSVDLVLGVVECLVEPAVASADEVRVKRLDLARDFGGVARTAALLSGLQTIHRPWAKKNAVFNDGSRNGAQTLLVGNKSSGVRLYDKTRETHGGVPDGTVRWESQCRGEWLENYGSIKQLRDVNAETVGDLTMNRWEWSAMGHEVTGTEEAVERVMRAEWLTAAEQRGLLGWMLMASKGRETPMSTQTAAKYRHAARRLGVAINTETFDSGGGFTARLDWESGTEVLGVA
jgi:hypothetical protein